MSDTMHDPPFVPFLTVRDLLTLFTEERRSYDGDDADPVKENTVYSWVGFSKPAKPGQQPRRYQDNPMPLPNNERFPGRAVWEPKPGQTLVELKAELQAWYRNRRDEEAQRRASRRREPCPCGCGQKIAPGTSCDRTLRNT